MTHLMQTFHIYKKKSERKIYQNAKNDSMLKIYLTCQKDLKAANNLFR